MPASEPARHALYARLEEVIGAEHAETLMTCLPRTSADEVATKGDIADLRSHVDRLEERIDERFDRVDERFDRMSDSMREQQRFYVGTTVASMTALTAAFSVVVAVFG